MWILKGLLLAVWLAGFATIARIYFEIRRINPHGGAISVSPGWIAFHTTRSAVWWIATIVWGAGSFALTRAWSGPLAFWIAVAVTDLFPIVALAVYMKLNHRGPEYLQGSRRSTQPVILVPRLVETVAHRPPKHSTR